MNRRKTTRKEREFYKMEFSWKLTSMNQIDEKKKKIIHKDFPYKTNFTIHVCDTARTQFLCAWENLLKFAILSFATTEKKR